MPFTSLDRTLPQGNTPRKHLPRAGFARRLTLTGELAWVLVIKSIALFLIWLAFFSTPTDPASVEHHLTQTLLGPPAASSAPHRQGHPTVSQPINSAR